MLWEIKSPLAWVRDFSCILASPYLQALQVPGGIALIGLKNRRQKRELIANPAQDQKVLQHAIVRTAIIIHRSIAI